MAGRTLKRFTRVYVDGYDMSGYSRTIGPLLWEFEPVDLTADLGDSVKGYLPGTPTISPGTLNTVFDNTATTGAHAVLSAQNDDRVVLVTIGDRAAPAEGNPAFMGEFLQLGYHADEDGGSIVANVPFGPWEGSSLIAYGQPWGTLAHALGAETAANSEDGYDDGCGAATSYGGYIVWHVTAGDGTATIKLQHCDTADGAFADVGGLTSGVIDCSSVQTGLAVTTAKTTTINQFVRWQVALGTATTLTFVLGFMRGRY